MVIMIVHNMLTIIILIQSISGSKFLSDFTLFGGSDLGKLMSKFTWRSPVAWILAFPLH